MEVRLEEIVQWLWQNAQGDKYLRYVGNGQYTLCVGSLNNDLLETFGGMAEEHLTLFNRQTAQ